jgi:NAD(P)-dependent dehydrogenase (short-subunit alcohol dehydrogenase family)
LAHNPPVDLGLAERACIVTGASRGIGRATALGLAREGAAVLLVGRDRSALDATADACRKAGGQAQTLPLDVTSIDAGQQLADACQERFDRLDVLVNNAGTSAVRSVEELTD